VTDEVQRHVEELRELANIYVHTADVCDVFKEAYKRLATLLDRVATAEAKFDKIIWRVEE